MKVLLTSGIYPPDIGGPARIIERLATDLQKRGIEVSVLAFGKDLDQKSPFLVEKTTSKLFFAFKLTRLVKDVDLVYAFDLYTAGFLSWFIGKKILKKKLVVRFAGDSAWESASNSKRTHDDIVTFQKKYYGLRSALIKMARRWILVEADKVVAVSNFMKNLAIIIGVPSNRIAVIYNAVDFIENSLDIKIEDIPDQKLEDKKIIMTAGRLVPWKGIDGLLEVVKEMKETKDLWPFQLLVIGNGPDKERLLRLKNNYELTDDEVKMPGAIKINNPFAMLVYYKKADVFVLNSQYEGLSHVLLEALSVGVPVIASSCGGNPEVIENEKNGLLVEYNNVAQLKTAIKRMLTEKKWHTSEFKDTCRESLKKFNWQNVIEQTVKEFQNV